MSQDFTETLVGNNAGVGVSHESGRFENKVITTMVIDDRTYCVRSAYSLIWGFGESCAILHVITSEPE